MSAAKSIDDCARWDLALTAYADGELDPGHAVDLEAHLRACPACFERVMLTKAMRASLRRVKAPRCPDALRARLAAVVQEPTKSAAPPPPPAEEPVPRLVRTRYAVALAAAAGVVFAVGAARQKQQPSATDTLSPMRADVASVASVESLLDDLVVQHAQPLPPETTDPEDLPRFDPFVGVPVRDPFVDAPPRRPAQPKALPAGFNFKGARVHAVRNRRAALLQYTAAGNHRVTVYLFNSRELPVQRAPVLQPRVVRERPVYVGRINGYSVAAAERSGVGYALASDLGDEESTQLVLAAAAMQ